MIKNWNSSTIGGKEYTLVDEAGLRVMLNNDEDVTCASYITNINPIFIDRTEFNQDIGSWNTSNLINMIIMFVEAFAFNQNQTGWCETNILSQLSNFAKDSSLKGFNIPNWGTCPTLRGMDRNRNISDSDTNLTFTLGDTINFVVNATSSFLSKIYSPNWKYDKLHT